ncbi:hypothetical protein ACU5EH_22350 [Aliivibrio salmonicida]
MADQASKESGTSYEEYIRLFSASFDKEFKQYYPIHEVKRFAREYGYTPKSERQSQY